MCLNRVSQLVTVALRSSEPGAGFERGNCLSELPSFYLHHSEGIQDSRTGRVQFECVSRQEQSAIEVLALPGVRPGKIVAGNSGGISGANRRLILADAFRAVFALFRFQRRN